MVSTRLRLDTTTTLSFWWIEKVCEKYDWLKTGPAQDITRLPISKTFTDAFRTAEGDPIPKFNKILLRCMGSNILLQLEN